MRGERAACDFVNAAEAYAAGNASLADRYFALAWKGVLPAVRGVARRTLRDDNLVDDAIQVASMKVWAAVRRGYKPTKGWPQIASTAAHHAAVQVLDKAVRHRCDGDVLNILDDPAARDSAEFSSEQRVDRDADGAMTLEHFAVEAERRGGGPHSEKGRMFGAIIREVAKGHTDLEAIAAALDRPSGTIRRLAWEMRQIEGLFESLDKREVLVTGDEAEAIGQLFSFEYAEI